MIDITTKLPLRVSTEGSVGPFIRLSYEQIEILRRTFDEHGIRYSVQENAISLNGGPYMAVVDLGRGADATAVQAVLDSVH